MLMLLSRTSYDVDDNDDVDDTDDDDNDDNGDDNDALYSRMSTELAIRQGKDRMREKYKTIKKQNCKKNVDGYF